MASFSLSNLNGSNGFRSNGIAADDWSGSSVSSAGDVNGDGIDDVIIGAYLADPNGRLGAGESYVVFGSAGWSAAAVDLAALDGTNGFRIDGIDFSDYSGSSVSSAGDVNGDGVDDVIFSAYLADPNDNANAGESYVVFGSAGWSAASVDLASLDGSNGFRIDGINAYDYSGHSVSSAGDVNGDGIGDVIIGAHGADPNGNEDAGESYVVFGAAGWIAAAVDLADLDGTNGFRIDSFNTSDGSGYSVSAAGDINGDGIDDVVIGSPYADPNSDDSGGSYVVFGAAGWNAASVDLAALDGSNGFRIDGIDSSDSSGCSVSSAGDVNGDGIDDVIIGAYGADPYGNSHAGESYVVFGSAGWSAASVDLASLDGSNGFRIDGIDADDYSGVSVSSAGDINGDGVDDVIIGAPGADPNGNQGAGESYVVFGSAGWNAASINLAALDGRNGFRIDGIDRGDYSGHSVSSAGDVNGDGFADLLIGAYGADANGNPDAGESYVLFGRANLGQNTLPTGTVTISGEATQNTTLTADTSTLADVDGLGVLSYQWQRFFASIPGATESSYTLTQQDVGADIRLVVSYTDFWGYTETVTSAFTAEVQNVNDAPTGQVIVIGVPALGRQLSADTSGLTDLDGLGAFSYQWQRDGVDVAGATQSTFDLTEVDIGTSISVVVSYTDSFGAEETVSSLPKGAVTDGTTVAFSLSNLNGLNGFRIDGIDASDYSGWSVSSAGDVNGDSIDDVIIGAHGADPNSNEHAGESYVVFGSAGWSAASVDLASLDGSNGFRIDGIDEADSSGFSVSSAGDVNGDSIDDVIIGAHGADPNGNELAGESYVVFGSAGWSAASVDLASLDGSNGFRIDGINAYDYSGVSVSSAGDVNGDGIDDVIIGARSADPNGNEDAGESYVVFGSAGWSAASVDLSTLNGSNGFRIDGIDAYDYSGRSVSSAGDVNGDGIDDVIIGAYVADPNGNWGAGESYVVFGSAAWSVAAVDLAAIDGSNGFRIDGIDADDYSGHSVSSAGDVNGDGIDDVIIGAYYADPNGNTLAGESYVVFGADGWSAASVDLSTLNGSNGFRIDGIDAYGYSGWSVSTAGDVNGDGIDDVIIGAPGADPNGNQGAGESYVVFGSAGWTSASVDLAALDGNNGFRIDGIDGGDTSGGSVASAGDVNGDGFADLLIGANGADPTGIDGAGESYVLFGSAAPGLNAPTGSVIVSGDATEDAILTADASTVADADGLGTLNYQWQRDGVSITGATSATYTLTQADVGSAIRAVVSYTDLWGNFESVASAATGAVVNVNDAPTGAVTISGLAEEGRTLSANVSTLSDEDGLGLLNYQWQRGGVDIIGATSSSYVLTQADVGSQMTVVVSYEDSFGTQESVTSNATGAVSNVNDAPTGAVTISGTVAEDQVLTATNTLTDEDGIGTLSYQWQRGGQDITGATSDTYTLTQADVGAGIRIVVSYEDGFGTAESVASATTVPVENVNDAPTGTVTISGQAIQGQTLTANAGLADTDGLGVLSYQWQRYFAPIPGAMDASYTLTQEDVGADIRLVVSYTDLWGYTETVTSAFTAAVENVNDAPAGQVIVSGVPALGRQLSADTSGLTDLDGLGAFSYQWQRDGVDVAGATQSTFDLTEVDIGTSISVVVSYTDGFGAEETVSSLPKGAVTDGTTVAFSLSNLNGLNGFRINGIDIGDQSGYSVSSAGDVNGDGIDDVIIGAPYGDPNSTTNAGESYVVFGVVNWRSEVVELRDLDGINGFRINGIIGSNGIFGSDQSGASVSSAGDVNGDGIDDVIIGAWQADSSAGESYVVFGSAGWSTATVDLAALDGTNGFRLDGIDAGDSSGYSVSSAGDVNGDGIDDVIIGASGAAPNPNDMWNAGEGAGESYVVFGSAGWSAASVDLSTLNGSNGFRIDGIDAYDYSGRSVSAAGDVNGDGIDDVIIGAYGAAPNGSWEVGQSYVIFGSAGWNEASVDLSALDGSNGFRIDGIDGSDYSGWSVSTAGDVNGDGIDDVIIGAYGADLNGSWKVGESYVVFGAAGWSAASVDLASLDGSNGFRIDGIDGSDYSGYSVSSAGDVNGDGIDDVIIGAYVADPNGNSAAGESYVVFGSAEWSTASVDLAALDGNNGFQIDGIDAVDYSGRSVSSAGDVNGDGFADLLIGADGADPSGIDGAGESYVLFGNATPGMNAPTGIVTVTGDAREDSTLTADTSAIADLDGLGAFSYQWQRDEVDIAAATENAYTLTQEDVEASIRVVVSYTDLWGVDESVTSAATTSIVNVNDEPTGDIIILGDAVEGQELSGAIVGLEDPDGVGDLSYQWRRDGSNIEEANSETYVLTQADVGSQITLVIAYIDGQGTPESLSSASTSTVENVNNAPIGLVAITGTATQGEVLTAENTLDDIDGLGTVTYQWQRGSVDVAGANEATYTLGQIDVGKAITVRASYVDGFGAQETVTSQPTALIQNVNDAVSGVVVLAGVPIEGQVLTATNSLVDLDGIAHIEYQWFANGEPITDATSATYLLTQADVGKFITVVLRLTDNSGFVETVSSDATPEIRNINDLPTGVIVVIGTPAEGATLTADTSALSDEDGLGEYSYQWQRDGSDITGATGPTYTLTQTDVGAAVRVVVSYTDDQGTAETVTSTDVMDIVNVNDSPTGSVVILGDAVVSGTLTVSTGSLADEDGLGFFSYQWLRDESPLEGATAETHTLTPEDVGTAISVTVSYTDGYGADEVVSSASTDPVASSMNEFTSIVTTTLLDRFGQVITDGSVAVRESDGGPEVFVREVSDDTATGTVFEIVVQPSTDVSSLDFEFYDNAGLVDFQVSQTLSDWFAQTNTSVTDQVIFSGFGAPDGSLALLAGQETVVGRFETAPDVDFDLAGIFLNGTPVEAISVQDVALDAQQNNVFTHSVNNGANAQVTADKTLDVASENAIGAFDALQALRLAVGLTKSDGTAEWHDYFAADINQDGRVGADDALNILKFAVGLTDGPAADWVFVDGNADYSDVTRQNSGYSEGMLQTDVADDTSVNLIGILVGDVDGSYALTAI